MAQQYKLYRKEPGIYQTEDGLFSIWHESRAGHENRWYVNHRDFDETLYLGGFPRKYHAVEWLKREYAEQSTDYFVAESPSSAG